jgi:hypothetical protein
VLVEKAATNCLEQGRFPFFVVTHYDYEFVGKILDHDWLNKLSEVLNSNPPEDHVCSTSAV